MKSINIFSLIMMAITLLISCSKSDLNKTSHEKINNHNFIVGKWNLNNSSTINSVIGLPSSRYDYKGVVTDNYDFFSDGNVLISQEGYKLHASYEVISDKTLVLKYWKGNQDTMDINCKGNSLILSVNKILRYGHTYGKILNLHK